MKKIREILEEAEERNLSPLAMKSRNTRGRLKPEDECDIRLAFQHDRDRIIHSKAFRRLKHKTQVLILPEGDHYRTRLTHTLEVSQIARTIARALRLNEDLVEAISLGHDLGHTPFGHAGEEVLNNIVPGGFHHAEQSLRVVDFLEKGGQGLNLTFEVRDGIRKHSKGKSSIFPKDEEWKPATMEGMVVRVSDVIAYLNHDLDDALRAKIIREDEIPEIVKKEIGATYSKRIDSMVKDVIFTSMERGEISMSERMLNAMEILRTFMFERVYESEKVRADFKRCYHVLEFLYEYYMKNRDEFIKDAGKEFDREPLSTSVCDFVAGMTDRYALALYEEKFIPKPWIY